MHLPTSHKPSSWSAYFCNERKLESDINSTPLSPQVCMISFPEHIQLSCTFATYDCEKVGLITQLSYSLQGRPWTPFPGAWRKLDTFQGVEMISRSWVATSLSVPEIKCKLPKSVLKYTLEIIFVGFILLRKSVIKVYSIATFNSAWIVWASSGTRIWKPRATYPDQSLRINVEVL